uniref:MADF domain-containing protein n=1 Tax=Oryzias melastigma TaxID=30732 RepID=A0A3B3DYU1_ORYME
LAAPRLKLIIAVCARPELYDSKLVMYRDRAVRKKTWNSVSEEVGLPPDQCRKRWKSLRDRYMRDKRKELERRNSSEGGPCKRWKYSAVPSFLDPFFSPREMSGNMDSSLEDRTGEYDPEAETLLNLDREILRALQAGPPAPPPLPPMSDTELFLKSIIPMIDVLPPVRRGALKLKIHSLVFEAVSESM